MACGEIFAFSLSIGRDGPSRPGTECPGPREAKKLQKLQRWQRTSIMIIEQGQTVSATFPWFFDNNDQGQTVICTQNKSLLKVVKFYNNREMKI